MKYIDADRLRAIINQKIKVNAEYGALNLTNRTRIANHAQTLVLKEILSVIDSLQQEQPEVDLDALVNEAFDKYSSVDGYGQLSVSFNRAELYSFIKKIARKEEQK